MEQITEIFIKDFRCLKYFSLELSPKDKLNINVFVGKNGSGKSTLLDALFEIGSNFKRPTPKFAFYIKNKDKIILGNRTENNLDNVEETELENEIWNKVFRFYTGGTERCLEIRENINKNAISFQGNNLKWILFSTLLSGAWKNPQNEKLIEKFNSLLLDLKGFTLKNIYVDIKNEEKNEDILNLIKLAETTDKLSDNVTRYIIKWDDIKYEKDFSTSILETFTRNDNVLDTGFWYTKLHSGLLHSETLSDGELGLIRRFSLILLLKELKREEERSLVLLDEPETHFNENWKRHFIYLIEEALKDTCHDVFIATHSAMLITDVKRDELYHFELVNDKIKTFPVSLNTYATNIVDIGKALFDLEADIGERSKNELENLIKGMDITTKQRFKTIDKHKQALQNKLKEVGPGEWRWKIRSKINQLEKADSCCNYKNKENNDHDS